MRLQTYEPILRGVVCMTDFPEEQLYGKMPLIATGKFLKQIPQEFKVYELWAHFGEFLKRYYGDNEKIKINEEVIQKLLKSFEDEHHSGYSHGVVSQTIMKYLAGDMDDEDKEFVRRVRHEQQS